MKMKSEREDYLQFLKIEKIGGKGHPLQKYVEEELEKYKANRGSGRIGE